MFMFCCKARRNFTQMWWKCYCGYTNLNVVFISFKVQVKRLLDLMVR